VTENIALIDWDGTIRRGFTIIDWLEFLAEHYKQKKNLLYEMIEKFAEYENGSLSHDELANDTAYIYSNFLKGLNSDDISILSDEFILEDKYKLFSFSIGLFEILKKYNINSIVISGCPIEILNSYKKIIGFEYVHGLKIRIEKKIYKNEIITNTGISKNKEKVIKNELLLTDKLAKLSFGNSISDMPLFNNSKVSFVVNNESIIIPSYKVDIADNNQSLILFENEIRKMGC
jgi:phosphoserine phosphatase